MNRFFEAAPWAASLKAISLLGAVVLCCVSFAAFRAVPTPTGFTHQFGLAVALTPLLVLAGCALFVVRGYNVSSAELAVQRLVTSTRIPLEGLVRVWVDPDARKGSMRLAGNGGLFSFSGWFYSKRLGRYRLFATDFTRAVVLKFHDRVVVVTPAAPEAFVRHVQMIVPGVRVGGEQI